LIEDYYKCPKTVSLYTSPDASVRTKKASGNAISADGRGEILVEIGHDSRC
jgi:hypothetical protein